MKKPPTSTFIPFTANDCVVPGLPAPSLADVELNAIGIYCEYHGVVGGDSTGVLFLTLNYVKDGAKAKTGYDSYSSNVETQRHSDWANGAKDFDVIDSEPNQKFVIEVYQNNAYPNPDDSIYDLHLYNFYFVIYVTGSVTNTSQFKAEDLGILLMTYAEHTSDRHYVQSK